MNNVYYGVSPSSDFFAHYGVKGMRWGVRKAIERGDQKALARHYNRAAKKLAKLSQRTDVELQKNTADHYNKIAKGARRVGRAGLGTALALQGIGSASKLLAVHFNDKRAETLNKAASSLDFRSKTLYDNSADHYKDLSNKYWNINNTAHNLGKNSPVGPVALGMAVGGYGTFAGAKAKSIIARKRTTAKGHAKAVSKRDAWKREMDFAFKGTKYGNSHIKSNKRRRRKR